MTLFGGWLRTWTPSQALLRALVALGPLLAMAFSLPAGAEVWWLLFVLVFLVGIGSALLTDSSMGVVATVLVLFWWGTRVAEPLSAWVLAAAAALVASHVGGMIADYGPPSLAVERRLVLLWVRRAALIYLAAPVAWWVARLVDDAPEQPGIWVAGLAACLGAVVAATVSLRLPATQPSFSGPRWTPGEE